MGFLANLKGMFGGKSRAQGSGGGRSSFGGNDRSHWVYARCRRCGEPLRGRVDLLNEPSQDDDGETWIVRKSLSGSGKNLCFQTIEVTLHFDAKKANVLRAEAAGGELITPEEYQALLSQSQNQAHSA